MCSSEATNIAFQRPTQRQLRQRTLSHDYKSSLQYYCHYDFDVWCKDHFVSWEPEGLYCSWKMFPCEPEGRYRQGLCTAIAPFWFSMEHRLKLLCRPLNAIITLMRLVKRTKNLCADLLPVLNLERATLFYIPVHLLDTSTYMYAASLLPNHVSEVLPFRGWLCRPN